MTPSIDGRVLHFESRGLFDGVSVLWDEETETLWHHVTGEALAGPLVGSTMPMFNLLQMTVDQALDRYPDLYVAMSDRPIRAGGTERWVDRDFELEEVFVGTIAEEDSRRPTMEIRDRHLESRAAGVLRGLRYPRSGERRHRRAGVESRGDLSRAPDRGADGDSHLRRLRIVGTATSSSSTTGRRSATAF